MAIAVKVQTGIPVITVKQINTGLQATNPVAISTTLNVNKLENLADVDASNKQDGDALIYHANTHNYVVEKVNLGNAVGNLDGGVF
jgi:hypothetical protein